MSHTDLVQIVLDELRLYRHVAGRQIARRAGPARKPQGAGRRDGRVREPRRVSRACQPGHGQRRRQRRRHGQSDDPAQRQGARIRHGVPAGLGGGPVPEPALDGGERARRPRRGAPPRLCRADPARGTAPLSRSPPTGASTANGRARSRSRFVDELPQGAVEIDDRARASAPARGLGRRIGAANAGRGHRLGERRGTRAACACRGRRWSSRAAARRRAARKSARSAASRSATGCSTRNSATAR